MHWFSDLIQCPLCQKDLELMYFLRLHVCQSCSHLWLHLRNLTDETPCNPVPTQAAARLSWLLTKCFEDMWSKRNTTTCCDYEM